MNLAALHEQSHAMLPEIICPFVLFKLRVNHTSDEDNRQA